MEVSIKNIYCTMIMFDINYANEWVVLKPEYKRGDDVGRSSPFLSKSIPSVYQADMLIAKYRYKTNE